MRVFYESALKFSRLSLRKRWKSFRCSGGIEPGVNWLEKEKQLGFCDQDQPRFQIR